MLRVTNLERFGMGIRTVARIHSEAAVRALQILDKGCGPDFDHLSRDAVRAVVEICREWINQGDVFPPLDTPWIPSMIPELFCEVTIDGDSEAALPSIPSIEPLPFMRRLMITVNGHQAMALVSTDEGHTPVPDIYFLNQLL
jgi:hypothetical protein